MKFDPSGGYRRLDSWVMASIVQLANFRFCAKFVTRALDPTGRQYDQMTQAELKAFERMCRRFEKYLGECK